MASERELQFECARMQSDIQRAEAAIAGLRQEKDKILPLAKAETARLIRDSKKAFDTKKAEDLQTVTTICKQMADRAEALLDTFPDLDAKEFAGRYEVRDLQDRLSELYPADLVEDYICVDPLEFETEGDAYQVYTMAEHRIVSMKKRSIASACFSGLNSLMESAADIGGLGAKVALIVVGIFLLATFIKPFFLLGIYTVTGVTAIAQGKYVSGILRQLFSVKEFLNDEYDEDIFQHDKSDVMSDVHAFLDSVVEDYTAEIESRQFTEPTAEIKKIMDKAEEDMRLAEVNITAKLQNIEFMKQQAAAKLVEYEQAVEARKQAAQNARAKYLNTFEWQMEWYPTLFLDVNSEDKIIQCNWTKGNTLYVAKSIDLLQQFSQLAVFQNVMHVHPSFAGQVVIDYKYMGGNLLPFSRLPTAVIDVCVEPEKIEKKMASLNMDVRARCNNILQSCASIEDFNALMATYDVTGESYVILHLFGIASFGSELKTILKNGPKVGYFIKLYATMDEFTSMEKDFPYDDIQEFAEVGDKVLPRTMMQLQRIVNSAP